MAVPGVWVARVALAEPEEAGAMLLAATAAIRIQLLRGVALLVMALVAMAERAGQVATAAQPTAVLASEEMAATGFYSAPRSWLTSRFTMLERSLAATAGRVLPAELARLAQEVRAVRVAQAEAGQAGQAAWARPLVLQV